MPLDVTARIPIAAAPASVADYAMDPVNDPIWIGGISEAELLGPPPVEKGSRVRRIASFLGKRIEYILEVAELEAGERMLMRSVKSPFPMAVTYTFERAPEGTRASIRVEGDPGRMYRFGGALMRFAVRRNITKDLLRLKRIVEAG
jgi:hypothetical protein